MSSQRSRRAPAFRPAFDACEARVVLSSLAGFERTVEAAARVTVSTVHALKTSIGPQVLSYAKAHLGVKVGDGECATLAAEAVKSAGGVPFYKLGPSGTDANYVWGDKITTLTPGGGSVSSVKPGDIIQYRDVTFKKVVRVDYAGGGWSMQTQTISAGHHTSVVSGVRGNFIDVLEQNVGPNGKGAGAKKIVQLDTIWGTSFTTKAKDSKGNLTTTTYTFAGGTMWDYRPYK